jgi:hypothetical protein
VSMESGGLNLSRGLGAGKGTGKRRFRGGPGGWGAVLVLALWLLPAAVAGQDPMPPQDPPAPQEPLPGEPAAEDPALELPEAEGGEDAPPAPAPAPPPPEPDTLRLPLRFASELPSGTLSGSWSWDEDDLLAVRALTLAELLELVPGVVGHRGGDHGSPVAMGGFALGGDRIRIFRNGMELLPLLDGTVDLARIGLASVGAVRVDRLPGEIRVHLTSRLPESLDPTTLLEISTGDFDTNLFRGSFIHPTVFSGVLEVGLDRMDTQGTAGRTPGTQSGLNVRYTRLVGSRAALSGELHRGNSNRDALYAPARMSRGDLSLQAQLWPVDGVLVTAYGQRSSESGEGMPTDSLLDPSRDREQVGVRAEGRAGPGWVALHGRRISGDGWLSSVLDAEIGAALPLVGGVEGSMTREGGAGDAATRLRLRGWTHPVYGVSLFGSWEDGSAVAPESPFFSLTPEEEDGAPRTFPLPPSRSTERRALRAGGRFEWRGIDLWGAWLGVTADSVLPLGLPFDRRGPALPAGDRNGWEAGARIPVRLLNGLAFEGWTQQWGATADAWALLPARSYEARLAFHDTFLPSGNLEVHVDAGVRGRDPMTVLAIPKDEEEAVPASVPFFQDWSARLQIRVVSVRVFLHWENVSRRPGNQDIPGRLLPVTRAVYGIRWILTN